MTTPEHSTPRHPAPVHDAAAAPATEVGLSPGPAQVIPLEVGGETRYALDLPGEPLSDDDLERLAVALHAAHSGPAVLVDVEEYAAEVVAAPAAEPTGA